MSPFILDGDVLAIEPVASHRLRIGDVVAFVRLGRPTVHRIVAKAGNDYLVAGDGYSGLAETVSPGNIVGRVVGIERRGRNVRLGLGPERMIIALLSRRGLLLPVWARLYRVALLITRLWRP